jgi:hypothetical protein
MTEIETEFRRVERQLEQYCETAGESTKREPATLAVLPRRSPG